MIYDVAIQQYVIGLAGGGTENVSPAVWQQRRDQSALNYQLALNNFRLRETQLKNVEEGEGKEPVRPVCFVDERAVRDYYIAVKAAAAALATAQSNYNNAKNTLDTVTAQEIAEMKLLSNSGFCYNVNLNGTLYTWSWTYFQSGGGDVLTLDLVGGT